MLTEVLPLVEVKLYAMRKLTKCQPALPVPPPTCPPHLLPTCNLQGSTLPVIRRVAQQVLVTLRFLLRWVAGGRWAQGGRRGGLVGG